MSIRLEDMYDAVEEFMIRTLGLHAPGTLVCPIDHAPSCEDVAEFLRCSSHTRVVRIDNSVEQMTAICDCCDQTFPLETTEETA